MTSRERVAACLSIRKPDDSLDIENLDTNNSYPMDLEERIVYHLEQVREVERSKQDRLREALTKALKEIETHNIDYHHTTSQELLYELRSEL